MFTDEQIKKMNELLKETNETMERKIKVGKKLKKMAICSLCSVGVFTGLMLMMTSISVDNSERCSANIENILDDSNYEKYNLNYKLEQTEKILTDYENGLISQNEFLKLSKEIQDYDELTYVLNANEVSAEDKKAFVNNYDKLEEAKNLGVAGVAIGTTGLAVTSLGALITTIAIFSKYEEEKKAKKQEKEIAEKKSIEKEYDGQEQQANYEQDDKVIIFDKDFLKNRD